MVDTNYITPSATGFPSPAEDYQESRIDIQKLLLPSPASTFYFRVKGSSMERAGIFSDDLLIVDRSQTPQENSIVIAAVDGEFLVRRLLPADKNGRPEPLSRNFLLHTEPFSNKENPSLNPDSPLKEGDEIWGVVIWVLHKV